MIELIDFYSSYQYDYYVYKLTMLRSILKTPDSFKNEFLGGQLDDYKLDDFVRVLKSEIRQSYFHITETLFELIFALVPKSGIPSDMDVFLNLSTSDWSKNYKKIFQIANEESGLNFLDDKIKVNEIESSITISRYLFYFGITNQIPLEYLEMIDSSITAIKMGLKTIAKDFSNREEYNSYKHSLRIMPVSKGFQLKDKVKNKVLFDIDLKDSMSYITQNKKNNELILHTKKFDTERDYQLVLFCTNLINNIIQLRKGALSKIKPNGNFPIHFFGEDELKKACTSNVSFDIEYKVKI